MTRIAELTRENRDVGDSTQAATIVKRGRYRFDVSGDLSNAELDSSATDIELAIYHEVDGKWRHFASIGYKGGSNPTRGQPALSVNGDVDANTRVQARLTIRGARTRAGMTLDATEIV